jgi:hypothetical protein
MVAADVGISRTKSAMLHLEQISLAELWKDLRRLEEEAWQQLGADSVAERSVGKVDFELDLRYQRQSFELKVPFFERDDHSARRSRH